MSDGPSFADMERGLGRVQYHDPQSWNYLIPMGDARAAVRPPADVTHRFYGGVRDQRNIGACTYFAVGDYYSAQGFYRRAERERFLDEACLRGYSRATELDTFPGTWYLDRIDGVTGYVYGRGEDTGSSSIGMWRTVREQGLASRVEWAMGLAHVLDAIQDTPICIGIPWKAGMMTPDRDGLIHYTGDTVGGHEVTLMRVRTATRRVYFPNHWTKDWGVNGWASMTFDDLGQALADGGDACRFYR